MVTLTIDNKKISVPEGTTIMKAAASAGIIIPHLCYLEGINEISACKVCVVEVQGKVKLVTACNNPVEEGMVLFTNSPKVRSVRRTNVELILSQHNSNCATCVRSGNCNLQKLSNDLGILDIPYKKEIMEMPWNREFPLIRDFGKCIKCMRCVQICDKVQALHIWDVQNTGSRTTVDVSRNRTIEESDCSICGQCITHCPTGALRERDDTAKVFRALADPEIVTVVQVAPAVRTAWAESLNLPSYMATEGRMVAALKRIGFDYVPAGEALAHVHILLPGLGELHENPVSADGGSSFHCKIAPTDVRRGDEELFRGKDRSGAGQNMQYFHHALRVQEAGGHPFRHVQRGRSERAAYPGRGHRADHQGARQNDPGRAHRTGPSDGGGL